MAGSAADYSHGVCKSQPRASATRGVRWLETSRLPAAIAELRAASRRGATPERRTPVSSGDSAAWRDPRRGGDAQIWADQRAARWRCGPGQAADPGSRCLPVAGAGGQVVVDAHVVGFVRHILVADHLEPAGLVDAPGGDRQAILAGRLEEQARAAGPAEAAPAALGAGEPDDRLGSLEIDIGARRGAVSA